MKKLSYKSLNKGIDFLRVENLLDILLKNRGVEDSKALLNVNEKDVLDGMDFNNMYDALVTFNKYIQKAKTEEVTIHNIVD